MNLVRNGTAIEAQTPAAAGRARLRPELQHRQDLRPGEGQGAARHVRLRRPRRRRLARACPTARRSCSSTPPSPTQLSRHVHAALEEEPGRGRHPHGGRRRQVARPPQEVQARQAADLAPRLERATIPTARTSTSSSTAPTAARPTTAASSWPSSTRSTSRPRRIPPGAGAHRASTSRWRAWSRSTRRGSSTCTASATSCVQPWVLGWRKHPVHARGLPVRGHRPRARAPKYLK